AWTSNHTRAGPYGPSTATSTSHEPASGSSKSAAWKSRLVAVSVVAGYLRVRPVADPFRHTLTCACSTHSPVAAFCTSTLRSTGPARNGVGEVKTVIW